MMLRKSHSSEWGSSAPGSANLNDASSAHTMALKQYFDELRVEISQVSDVFNHWMRSRRQVLEEDKQAYLRTLSEEHDAVEALKRQHGSLVTKRQQIVLQLQAEQREYEEGVLTNQRIETRRNDLAQKLKQLRDQTQEINKQVAEQETLLAECEAQARKTAARNQLEALLGEEKLGLSVDRVQDNVTKFAFKYIDPADWERKFVIIIDVSTNHYRIKHCEPMIPQLSMLVRQLEETGDFYKFLRRVRQSFSDLFGLK